MRIGAYGLHSRHLVDSSEGGRFVAKNMRSSVSFPVLRRPALRLMALLLFVIAQTPAVPAAIALAAWIDGSHQIELRADARDVTVVLRHQRPPGQNENLLPKGHQHGWLTRTVLTFTQGEGSWHPDHQFHFKSSHERYDGVASTHRVKSSGASAAPLSLVIHSRIVPKIASLKPGMAALDPAVAKRSDPVGLKAIVLLI